MVGDRQARILLVHDNASFRDLVRDLGSPATAHVVPSQPAFPPMDDLVRIAASHDLRPIGPPMSVEDSDGILAAGAQLPPACVGTSRGRGDDSGGAGRPVSRLRPKGVHQRTPCRIVGWIPDAVHERRQFLFAPPALLHGIEPDEQADPIVGRAMDMDLLLA